MPTQRQAIRVLVADDSAAVRNVMEHVINSDPDMLVVGLATNGGEVVTMAERLKPDLITMDIGMPGVSGLQATRAIMERNPTPIVVVSIMAGGEQNQLTFDAIRAGAVDVMAKPDGTELASSPRARETFLRHLKSMVGIALIRRRNPAHRAATPLAARASSGTTVEGPLQLIAIGASSGGPPVVAELLSGLDPATAPPIVVAQHIADGFGRGFAEWLGTQTRLSVQLASHGDAFRPGMVYVAPDRMHMEATAEGRVRLHTALRVNGHRPSISVLFHSVAMSYGSRAAGILLTGMGRDGADGLCAMKTSGAFTITQDEASCVVASMPNAARECDGSSRTATPAEIRAWLGLRRFRASASGTHPGSRS